VSEKKVIEKDLDFENFSVEQERAQSIRDNVRRIKDELDLDGLRLLVSELGSEVRDEEAAQGLHSLLKDQSAKAFIPPADHVAGGFKITMASQEFQISFNNRSLLELSYLPKGNDFLVFHLEEADFAHLQNLKELLKEEIKAARAKKSSRAAAFKAKFEG
jgi:hypothetical protein